jgi:DsbC/DsbD-like thiol-disulfide interchange protein
MITMRILFPATIVAAVLTATTPAETAPVTVSAEIATADRDSLVLLWTFDLADRWHLYGPHRNDTGQPPAVRLDLPEGWRAGPLEGWPVPGRHVVADMILDHIYEQQLRLRQTVHHPPGAIPHEVAARLRWLVCADLCVPGDTLLALDLPGPVSTGAATRLAIHRRSTPGPLPTAAVTTHATADGVVITAPGAQRLEFVPDARGPAMVDAIADAARDGDELHLRLERDSGRAGPLSGLLIIHHSDDRTTHGTITVPWP